MPQAYPTALRGLIGNAGKGAPDRCLWGAAGRVSLGRRQHGTGLGGRLAELSGRSILVATRDQAATASVVIELDSVAARLIICPPDLAAKHLPAVVAKGGVDAIVSDQDVDEHHDLGVPLRVICSGAGTSAMEDDAPALPTEWILLTSGTTGAPKMIVHTLSSLTSHLPRGQSQSAGVVWGTFYDIRRYGGLQIFLRAVLGARSLVLAGPDESVGDYLLRLGARGATHISGTPSHWRRVLMSPQARAIAPRYIRLSGEVADQAILNALRSFYSPRVICHAFASTEAGVGFEVTDGLEGFPASVIQIRGEHQIKIEDGSLRIRSPQRALRYVDEADGPLAGTDGFVDTGDAVEMRGDRYYFLGRRNRVVNVGGLKVYPEEVETVINRHPAVRASLVRPRRSSIMGALVTADVVLKREPHASDASRPIEECKREILEICRASLDAHKVPAAIRCVPALDVSAAGKLVRPAPVPAQTGQHA
jgi:acyl-coenzyme A synthetase/AMP-(fatty) acid ligase